MDSVRSPLLMNCHDSALLIVDIQEKLLPHIHQNERLLWNVGRLIKGASALNVSIFLSEQYPKGLGPTVNAIHDNLADQLDDIRFEKTMFSCRECTGLTEQLLQKQVKNVVIVGMETHVCVLQTTLDLLSAGFEIYVCNDAVGSRFENDYWTALSRMEASGATLVTTEMALFEWCEQANRDEFKTISRLVRDEFGSS